MYLCEYLESPIHLSIRLLYSKIRIITGRLRVNWTVFFFTIYLFKHLFF